MGSWCLDLARADNGSDILGLRLYTGYAGSAVVTGERWRSKNPSQGKGLCGGQRSGRNTTSKAGRITAGAGSEEGFNVIMTREVMGHCGNGAKGAKTSNGHNSS